MCSTLVVSRITAVRASSLRLLKPPRPMAAAVMAAPATAARTSIMAGGAMGGSLDQRKGVVEQPSRQGVGELLCVGREPTKGHAVNAAGQVSWLGHCCLGGRSGSGQGDGTSRSLSIRCVQGCPVSVQYVVGSCCQPHPSKQYFSSKQDGIPPPY